MVIEIKRHCMAAPGRLAEAGWHRLVLIAALLFIAGCGSGRPELQPIAPGATVLAFGDSITYGTGAGTGQDYPGELARITGWRVINAGVPGDTADQSRSRIEPLLSEHQPELVIVELGGNDFLRQQPASRVKEHLREIVAATSASGAITVLVAVPRLSLSRAALGALADSPIYAELAQDMGILLYEDELSDILSDDALRADRIHPNASGYQQLASGLAQFLAEQGLR